MNTNTNITSYMPQTYWTVLPIINAFYNIVYKKYLKNNDPVANNVHADNNSLIGNFGSAIYNTISKVPEFFFTNALFGKVVAIPTIAADYATWSKREICKTEIASILTLSSKNITDHTAKKIDSTCAKVYNDTFNMISVLKILKDINPISASESALKFKYGDDTAPKALELALEFRHTNHYGIEALEILKNTDPELALKFMYASYYEIKALEILKDTDHPELALKFKYASYDKIEALEILKDIDPELALKPEYYMYTNFIKDNITSFKKCHFKSDSNESGYNSDCLDSIMACAKSLEEINTCINTAIEM